MGVKSGACWASAYRTGLCDVCLFNIHMRIGQKGSLPGVEGKPTLLANESVC